MYVELHSRSAFSFLRGGSLPEELAEKAATLGMAAMALCDRDGVYGAPRFFAKAREQGIRPLIGAELTLEDGSILPVLVATRTGYQNLCRLITCTKLRAEKNKSSVRWEELGEFAEGLVALTGDEEGPLACALAKSRLHSPAGSGVEGADRCLQNLKQTFGARGVFVELQRHHVRGEERRNAQLVALARARGLPLVATNGVLYATSETRRVLDIFTCIRNHTHLDAAGKLLSANAERFLKGDAEMRTLFADLPEAVDNTARLAQQLQFTLDDLGYQFPAYPLAPGENMDEALRQQSLAGARKRYGADLPARAVGQLEHELRIISKLGFAGYFLIVADLIHFCRDHQIMAQGRGSAANSTVCFCLGITAVDPLKYNTLFERFLSEGRKGWPDIDIDLPSGERRERVIQEVYRRYGPRGAAMTANVITYRGRSAAREIGKALNLAGDVLDRFSNLFANGDFPHTLDLPAQMAQAGLPKDHPRAPAFVELYQQIYGLPRHLGQHSGGMIICEGTLDSIVPLENASMPGRVVAQWDKDDCEDLGIIKVDLLGLGMMSVLQDAITLTAERGHPVDLARIPQDDPATFELMQRADTIGVFQIESRAQMATLPRMKPKEFYDVVIEVAIIRPGPIQGRLMHPYLARRAKKQPVTYYHDDLEPVLKRTLGVPLFQEQMLQIAMVMAGFSGTEAEELRRALSFHRSQERMQKVEVKLRRAMEHRRVTPEIIEQIIAAISSFALYGFPESHAISFAILAYGSAYLKAHYPAEFYVSLLNNQPMGFYAPATLVKDARRHGLKVRAVCVERSDWFCTIEQDDTIRLGFCVVQGLRREHAESIVNQRRANAYASIDDFKRRTPLHKAELRTLAEIGALNCFGKNRRDALWEIEKTPWENDLFASIPSRNAEPERALDTRSPLQPMTAIERLHADYSGMQLTTGPHPMSLIRPQLPDVWRATDLVVGQQGQRVVIAGNVICRQRPGTAKGFVFISLEDETGVSNAIVNPALFEKSRLVITQESFLIIEGKLQTTDSVLVVQARSIKALRHERLVGSASYDFH